jgi:hypothetical protein
VLDLAAVAELPAAVLDGAPRERPVPIEAPRRDLPGRARRRPARAAAVTGAALGAPIEPGRGIVRRR